jgi:hypothetical protein
MIRMDTADVLIPFKRGSNFKRSLSLQALYTTRRKLVTVTSLPSIYIIFKSSSVLVSRPGSKDLDLKPKLIDELSPGKVGNKKGREVFGRACKQRCQQMTT